MTSQIGMMNKDSVALASDSAGTWNANRFGGQAYNTSDKIFQLAGRQSVGFMSNGPGDYMGLSWDRIMGMYREHIGTRTRTEEDSSKPKELGWITNPLGEEHCEERLNFLDGDETALDATIALHGEEGEEYEPGYLEDFIRFLNTNKHLQDEDVNFLPMHYEIKQYIDLRIPHFDALGSLVGLFKQQEKATPRTKSSIMEGQGKLHNQYSKMFEENLVDFSERCSNRLDDDPDAASIVNEVISKEADLIKDLCESYRNLMYGKKISKLMRGALSNIAGYYLATDQWKGSHAGAGLIIAGFGEKEEIPTMVQLNIMPKWKNEMRYEIEGVYRHYCAIPFAQADQIHTIIEGISPTLRWRLSNPSDGGNLRDILSQELESVSKNTPGVGDTITKNLLETQRKMNQDDDDENKVPRSLKYLKQLIQPLDSEDKSIEGWWGNFNPFVYRLAPPDLADVAEKMVELESTMQYVKNGLGAQVGGPIDVVSVTKEDGLIWIKRKSKIDGELNPRVSKTARERARHI